MRCASTSHACQCVSSNFVQEEFGVKAGPRSETIKDHYHAEKKKKNYPPPPKNPIL